MSKLPVIVGVGGINAAGRSANFHSYKRMVAESLTEQQMQDTWKDLALSMGLCDNNEPVTEQVIAQIIEGTLIRRIDAFDPDKLEVNTKVADSNSDSNETLYKSMTAPMAVTSAGCIPAGTDIDKQYKSINHPRGLKLTVFAASDLLNTLGLSWQHIINHVAPDQVAVYAGAGFGQVDDYSMMGLVASPLKGRRTSSKMLPLALPQMPADFINGYILNNVGTTGANLGACASFLYNLRQGVIDIQTGRARIAMVGSSEAPVTPPLIEGFRVMGALAEDHQLCKLDGSDKVDNRRACRPFSTNAGFTIGESSQLMMLMDDELALALGLNILGSVPDVFINADANKKSISAPGVGNYVTMAKATALAKGILGSEGLSQTYVQAHGTGTPQNRVTESHIFNEVAKTYEISSWTVTSVKAYVGHSIGPAAGDQLIASLGVWQYGYIPGIKTIDHIADDVEQSNLDILMQDKYVGEKGDQIKAVFVNSKGFGGNNATALVLSPQQTLSMLRNKHGDEVVDKYRQDNAELVELEQARIDKREGQDPLIYQFGTDVMGPDSVQLSQDSVSLSSFNNKINLPDGSEFNDYLA